MKSIDIPQTKQNLFTILQKGDLKISKIKKRIIALVGLTRVGKSSVYNWMLGRKMIGKTSFLQPSYVLDIKDEEAAAIKGGSTSVTLVPNIIDIDEQTSLIDLAGYLDSRNHVGVISVLYFLNSVFQIAQEVKFLIVFSENVFFQAQGNGWKNTLNGFIGMFRLHLLTSEIKDKIFSSVSLVCTRSKNPHQVYNYMKQVRQDLKNPELQLQNKQIINQMMERIISDQRVYFFQLAKPNLSPSPCPILKDLNSINWNFLQLHQIQISLGQRLINIPYKRDVKALSQSEKSALQTVIDQHFNLTADFSLIFTNLYPRRGNYYLSIYEFIIEYPKKLEQYKKLMVLKSILSKYLRQNFRFGQNLRRSPIAVIAIRQILI